jgi:hypothetical protein
MLGVTYQTGHAVMTLVKDSATGAKARFFHAEGTAAADLQPIIKPHVDSGTHVVTGDAVRMHI